MEAERESFVAECFWPGVEHGDLAALDLRIERVVDELGPGGAIRYLGSILLREDEVVLCRFEGTAEAVHEVTARADVPFERILTAAHSPWPLSTDGGQDDS